MGTCCACMYATLYPAYHERKVILPKYSNSLIFLRRFIDDIYGIWTGPADATWDNFKNDLNTFGKLKWIVSEPSTSVDFLDLTIAIDENRRLVFKTYEKPMNLYLYIPPKSAHPPGVFKSLVFGRLQQYRKQNTYTSDYVDVTRRFAKRLVKRGYSLDSVREMFEEAAARIDDIERRGGKSVSETTASPSDTLFFHWEYHPHGISRQFIRNAYKEHCEGHDGFDRMIVAYHRPKNIRDSVMRARLSDVEGSRASDVYSKLLSTGTIRQPTIIDV